MLSATLSPIVALVQNEMIFISLQSPFFEKEIGLLNSRELALEVVPIVSSLVL
jgi:hypothetical protein